MDAWYWVADLRDLMRFRLRWRSFAFGFVVGVVFMLCLFYAALVTAQPIPRDAARYQRDLIRNAHAVWGMSAPIATLAAQVQQESGWQADARSRVGAGGLTQFMPATAAWIADVYPLELGQADVYNPQWALRAQARYMKFLHERVSGLDDCERMAFALAAYNGGLGWVNRRKAMSRDPETCLFVTCELNPGILPSNQTQNADYSRRILLWIEPAYVAAAWGAGSCST